MSWIMTFSGLHYSLDNPQPDQVTLTDIAHHLSQICRYTGATKFFYSVAQHCLLGAGKMQEDGLSARLQLLFMMHDAPEAYYMDVNKPLKELLGEVYERLESKGMQVVWEAFKIDPPTEEEWAIVAKYDVYMFQNEISRLMPNPHEFPLEPLEEVEMIKYDMEYIEKAYAFAVKNLILMTQIEGMMKSAV